MSPNRRTAAEADELRDSLLEVARRLVARDGPAALTMRALAAEAGCAVGLPYKVFASRDELVLGLVHAEYIRLRAAFDEVVASAGSGTVGANLGRFAEVLLSSPAVGLSHGIGTHEALSQAIDATAGETGVVDALATTVADYLAAEKRSGRVDPTVDEEAFAFLIAGAVHNLLAAGPAYPKPSMQQLERMLAAVATRLSPPGQPKGPT